MEYINLDLIKHNPYQGREEYGDIEVLARSIANDDLQETPKARKNGKGYELKFGHRRVEAFRWLRENFKAQTLTDRYQGYTVVPLDIEEITDEQMFVGAVIENEHRKNLNDIERARMMVAYRDQFQKTSAEIGEKFGVSGDTVRGLTRLLNLPESVQEKIETGEITQGQARKLLTIARVDEKEVERAAKRLEQGQKPDDVMEQAFRSENAITMQFGWSVDGAARGGVGLWPLAMQPDKFPTKHLPELTAADVAKALDLEFTATLREKIEGYMRYLLVEQLDMVNEIERQPEDADLIERIAHLARPPACTACQFHAVADRAHYCGFKACHARKKTAWIQQEMAKASKKLGIAIHDPAKDGKTTVPLSEHSREDIYKWHASLVGEKDGDLRIAAHKNEYNTHKWTESNWCRLVLVGKRAAQDKSKREAAKVKDEQKASTRELSYEVIRERRNASQSFMETYATKIFATLFTGFDNIAVLCALTREDRPRKDAKKADALAKLRIALADRALDGAVNWKLEEKGPTAVAKFLQGVAAEWGVKLPADFLEAAKGMEPVSSETVEKKGKKK